MMRCFDVEWMNIENEITFTHTLKPNETNIASQTRHVSQRIQESNPYLFYEKKKAEADL
jgi:hypothetical protein